jgi:Ser/Thr protein kinase RdoA (MazF antagonist)
VSQAYESDAVVVLEEVARAALSDYGLPPAARVELINLSENATYLVREPGAARPAVLRVGRPQYSSPAEIASELAWVEAAREEADILAPAVIPTTDGRTVAIVQSDAAAEPRPCVMFTLCPGSEPSTEDMLPAFERMGAIAARLHNHARLWRPPRWFKRRTWDYDTTVGATPHWGRWQDGIGVGPEELALLDRLCGVLEERLDRYGKAAERFGLIHADMRLANLLFDGPDTWVIDFDDCGYSWFLYDLASAFTFEEDSPDVPKRIESWLRGYRQSRALSGADIEIVPTLIMLRRLLVLAWIASHENTELARAEGVAYTRATCELAERYLRGSLDWQQVG